MAGTDWHYPRTEFARRVQSLLVDGPADAISIFAPRRTGKTEFLTQDLAPYAEAQRHRVIYANLWQTFDSPLAILLYEFDRSLRGGSIAERLMSAAGDVSPKFRIQAPLGGGEIEVDFGAMRGTAPESHLLLIDQFCERFARDRRPTFLLFDEFQQLAAARGAAPLVAALRTSLDRRRGKVVSVFTGSSLVGLRKVFSTRTAPFFRFATQVELPELGEPFVDHLLRAFRKTETGRALHREEAIAAFEAFRRNPKFFRMWLEQLILHPGLSEAEVERRVRRALSEEFEFAERWRRLKPLERAMARLLAEAVPDPFGASGAARLADLTDSEAASPSKRQTAVNGLQRAGFADKWEDRWRIPDGVLEIWIRERPVQEF